MKLLAAQATTNVPVAAAVLAASAVPAESHNVQQYHQGLLVAVLISCGLWRDSMWEQLEGGALRWVCRQGCLCSCFCAYYQLPAAGTVPVCCRLPS